MRQRLMLALLLGFSLLAFAVVTLSAYAAPVIWEDDFGSELTQLTGADDREQHVFLDFDFPYFGTYYTGIFVNTNGLINFQADVAPYNSNKVEDFINAPCPMIAPFWSDMDLTSTGKVFFNQFNGRAVITWDRVGSFMNPLAFFTFQVQLMADGRIIFGYNGIPDTISELDEALVVGLSQGNGSSSASRKNYTDGELCWPGLKAYKFTPSGTIYEVFEVGIKPFDLDDSNLIFMPFPGISRDGLVRQDGRKNKRPVADAGSDQVGYEGSSIAFDASGSSDPDGDSLQYRWDYENDGTWDTDWSNDPIASRTWTDNWTGRVKVEVSDEESSFTDTAKVTVNNVAPTIDAGADQMINEGDTFVSPGIFSDPGADIWTATVNYDDASGDQPLSFNPDKTFSLSYVYTNNGTYTVTVRVTDDDGGMGNDTVIVTVNNVAPVVYAGADTNINEGDSFTSSGSFNDPGVNSWEATVDYGDGSEAQTLALIGKTFSLSHVYADSGTYTVTVIVTDGDGGTGSNIATVTVNNVAPVVYAGADTNINEGDSFTSSGSFNDPGVDSWEATVDYGDGSGAQSLVLTDKRFNLSHVYADNGAYTVTVTVTDGDGGTGSDIVAVTVNNIAPVVYAGADTTVDEGSTFTSSGSFSDPGADSWEATVDYGDGSGVQTLILTDKTFSLNHVYADNGAYTITVIMTDDDVDVGTGTLTVTVNNTSPVVEAGDEQYTDEGTRVSLDPATFTDEGWLDTHTAVIDWGDGTVEAGTVDEAGGEGTVSCSHIYGDNGVYVVSVTVIDKDDGMGSSTVTITALNVAPTVGEITSQLDPVEVNVAISASADFTDPGALDTHTAEWDWGDGNISPGTVDETGSSVSGDYTYANADVCTVVLTVTDDDGGSAQSTFQYVVVYDPNAGSVTGGGWIDSPEGAYAPDPSLTGKANFGFTSKYKKGDEIPTGQTEFNLHAADLNFHSTDYQWLVIAGAHIKLKGSGTINNAGDYGFMLAATDGQLSGGVDKFRIRIWDKDANDEIVYDNQMGDAEDADASDAIEGGSIVIHGDKEKGPQAAPSLLPRDSRLLTSFPNPANPGVWIPYQLSSASEVVVRIYDVTGRLVCTLDLGYQPAGFYDSRSKAAYWDGNNEASEPVANGVYFYSIKGNDFTAIRKMTIAK